VADPAAQTFNFEGIPNATGPGARSDATAPGGLNFSGIPDARPAAPAGPDRSQGAANPDAPDEDVILSNVKSAGRMLRGAARGAISTVQGLAAPIRRATGMAPATPPPAETTTAGTIGRAGEQIGEFFIPAAAATKFAKTINAARRLQALGLTARAATLLGAIPEAVMQAGGAYGLTRAQGGEAPGRAAGIAGALPVVGAAAEVAVPAILASAKRGVEKVLSTGLTEKMLRKAPGQSATVVGDAASDALRGPLLRSWTKWESATGAARQRAGQTLETLLAGPAGDTALPKAGVLDALDDLANAKGLSTVPAGGVQPGAGTLHQQIVRAGGAQQVAKDPALLKSIQAIKAEINKYPGDYISARDWHFKKSLWDDTVYGSYTSGAVTPLHERLINANRKTALAAANGVRELFATQAAPTVAAADAVVSRAIRYNELVKEAAVQAEGASPTLLRQISKGAAGTLIGGGVGYEAGGVKGAIAGVIGGTLASQLNRVLSSPAWKLLPAASKRALADAVTSGQADRVRQIVAPLLTAATSGRSAAAAQTSPQTP
jgi:hypothetical protein